MQTPTSGAGDSEQLLSKENEESRDLCCCLEDGRQSAHRLGHQWQRFGKFTADLLKNEVCVFETKLQILQDNLDKLSRENAELRDVCLFMNQMSTPGGNSGLAENMPKHQSMSSSGATTQTYALHSACASKINQLPVTPGEPSVSQKKTKESVMEDNDNEENVLTSAEGNSYISELEKRVERLETEKLEIMKSLSLAQTLPPTTSCHLSLDEPSLEEVTLSLDSPPDVHAFLDFIAVNKDGTRGADNGGKRTAVALSKEVQQSCSTETILGMVTLLNLSRRLDALRMMPIQDPQEKAEIRILSTLATVAWKQLTKTLKDSSQVSKQFHKREDKDKREEPYRHKYSNLREKKYSATAKVLRTEL